jgi:hypothetical protein
MDQRRAHEIGALDPSADLREQIRAAYRIEGVAKDLPPRNKRVPEGQARRPSRFNFDLWAERWRRHEARGDMIVVRYADDLVAGFEHESDARRFLDAMRDRLGKFALSLHPDKIRLMSRPQQAAALTPSHAAS